MGQAFRKLFDSIFGNREMRVSVSLSVFSCFVFFSSGFPFWLVCRLAASFVVAFFSCFFFSHWRQ
jgi:flagellar biosynthesis protein FliR